MESFVFINGKYIDKFDDKKDNLGFIREKYLRYLGMDSFTGIIQMTMDGVVMADNERARLMYEKALKLGIIDKGGNIIPDKDGRVVCHNLCYDEDNFTGPCDIDTTTVWTEDVVVHDVAISDVCSESVLERLRNDSIVDIAGVVAPARDGNFGVAIESVAPADLTCVDAQLFSTSEYDVVDVDSKFKESVGCLSEQICPGRLIKDGSVNLSDYVSWFHFNELVLLCPLEVSIDVPLFSGCKLVDPPFKMGKRFASGTHFYVNIGNKPIRDVMFEFEKSVSVGSVLFIRRLQRFYVVVKCAADDYTVLDSLEGTDALSHGGMRAVCAGTFVSQKVFDDILKRKNGFRVPQSCLVVSQFHVDFVTSCDFLVSGSGLVPVFPKSMEDIRFLRPDSGIETYETQLYFFLVVFFNDILFKLIGRSCVTLRRIRSMVGFRGAWFSLGRTAMFMGYLLSLGVCSIRGHEYAFSQDNCVKWAPFVNGVAGVVEKILSNHFFSASVQPFFGNGVETGVSPVESAMVALRKEEAGLASGDSSEKKYLAKKLPTRNKIYDGDPFKMKGSPPVVFKTKELQVSPGGLTQKDGRHKSGKDPAQWRNMSTVT